MIYIIIIIIKTKNKYNAPENSNILKIFPINKVTYPETVIKENISFNKLNIWLLLFCNARL